jgi:hypothetical protein
MIEQLVAGKRRGDRPTDPSREEARVHRVTLELSADAYARLRDTRARLADEHGRRLDDDALITALCEAAIANDHGEPTGRAKFQVAISVCPTCERATQDGGGRAVPIDDAALDRARCDAQGIGSLDGDAPERAAQAIPPAVVRFVWRRDHGRCQAPGCRSARGLEVHHLVRRTDGGSHEPANLVLLCSACHLAHHRGQLPLTPPAPAASHVGRAIADEARLALETLGFPKPIARAAVETALRRPDITTLEELIREALRACPRAA